MSTGEKLRELRQKKGLSLRGLARETGVIAASILLIERGRQPRTATLRKLAKALGPYGLSLLASEVKVHMSPAMPAPTHHRVAGASFTSNELNLPFLLVVIKFNSESVILKFVHYLLGGGHIL